MSLNDSISNHIFHNSTATTGTGLEYNTTGQELIVVVEFVSTGTFTAVFEGKCLSGNWKPIRGASRSTNDYTTTTSDKTSFWEVDISGMVAVRINLTGNTGVTSVYGKVVG